MYSVEDVTGRIPTILLRDSSAGSLVELCPERGAIVLRFDVGDDALLYLDRATFDDPKANVRGGIPLLFPSPGKLENDAWSRNGKSGSLKQHGFARNLAWTEVDRATDGSARVTLELKSNEETRKNYPWAFSFRVSYVLAGAKLAIEMRVTNDDNSPMPYGVGIHPYFHVVDADKRAMTIPTEAKRAFNNVSKKECPFEGFDFSSEVDMHLIDHHQTHASLLLGNKEGEGGELIDVRGSPEFTRWVVWSLPGKDFVCLEPWTSPGNALASGQGILELRGGASHDFSIVIERLLSAL